MIFRTLCRSGLSSASAVGESLAPTSSSLASLLRYDRKNIYHPYTSLTSPLPAYHVTSAGGSKIRLTLPSSSSSSSPHDEPVQKDVVDGMSSWWSTVHGYDVEAINEAIKAQVDKGLCHVMFGGLTHGPAVELSEVLCGVLPEGLEKIFYSCSGSVSVEVALKMSLQYQRGISRPHKNKFLSVLGGYHGDTLGCMSVSDPGNGMHRELFDGWVNDRSVIYAERNERSMFSVRDGWAGDTVKTRRNKETKMVRSIREHLESRDDIAAVIMEPMCQGAGGMFFHSGDELAAIRRLTSEHGALLVFDEIATGFGRTGELFACNHGGVTPDIITLGKAITGGYCSLGVTVTTDRVSNGISGPGHNISDLPFFHGPTFMGNPLALSIALASVRLLLSSPWKSRVSKIEETLRSGLGGLASHELVRDVRVKGAIGVVELEEPVRDMGRLQREFVEMGVWIRPFGKLVYIMPPFMIEEEELTMLCKAITSVVERKIV